MCTNTYLIPCGCMVGFCSCLRALAAAEHRSRPEDARDPHDAAAARRKPGGAGQRGQADPPRSRSCRSLACAARTADWQSYKHEQSIYRRQWRTHVHWRQAATAASAGNTGQSGTCDLLVLISSAPKREHNDCGMLPFALRRSDDQATDSNPRIYSNKAPSSCAPLTWPQGAASPST